MVSPLNIQYDIGVDFSKILKLFELPSIPIKLVVLLIIFVALGSFLRLNALDTKGILFSDAGRNLLNAHTAVQNHQRLWFSIPASVPYFAQSPLSLWYSMAIITIFGVNTHALSIGYALLSISALIITYEFLTVSINQKSGLLATMILAASPLAIASARVPDRSTPIPLFAILYLIALFALWKKKSYSLFFAGLTFALLLQFELSLAALIVLIPYVLWRSKQMSILKNKKLGWLVLGVGLGLLPQIVYVLTHYFASPGIDDLWINHKGWEFNTFQGITPNYLGQLMSNIFTYLGRVYVVYAWVGGGVLLMNLVGLMWLLWQQKNLIRSKKRMAKLLPIPGELAFVSCCILLISAIIHGASSETYFYAFTILLPIFTTTIIFQLPQFWKRTSVGILICLLVINLIGIYQHNFFVSNHLEWSYGPSIGEQKQVLAFIANRQDPEGYQLRPATGYEQQFPSAFANYDWLSLELKVAPQSVHGREYFLANPWENINHNLMTTSMQSVVIGWQIKIK